MSSRERSLPVGAEVRHDGVRFRVWAPHARAVAVILGDAPSARNPAIPARTLADLPPLLGPAPRRIALQADGDGYFAGAADAAAGACYAFALEDGPWLPDPASRFQPHGPHGPSELIDPAAFRWRDSAWRGPESRRPVLYELHVGTFTPDGTWDAAVADLPRLADLGIGVIELMPLATFPGRFGWGYDGVNPFAPSQLYGHPDEFRRFVDAAHVLGIGVILDVVYNHFGPDGCYLREYAPEYFSSEYRTEWGEALNFDGVRSAPVREYILANVRHWTGEYHLDGFRLDATQSMFDRSRPHIVTDIVRTVRAAAPDRRTLVFAENEPQQARLLRAETDGGSGVDAVWNDDFHHTARVALTGRAEAYYSDYTGSAQSLLSAVRWGYLYQGQYYRWQRKRRGTPAFDFEPDRFVNYLQNHDQVANSASGARLHELASAPRLRAMTALLLLAPGIPLLMQGQEFAASTPFLYFADHEAELARVVARGRAEFLRQFPSIATPAAQRNLPDPADERTFLRSKLDPAEAVRHAGVVALHRDLIALARTAPFAGATRRTFEGAVLAEHCVALRFFGTANDDRVLIVNLGGDLPLSPLPEPLLAPPPGTDWGLCWSSEAGEYGGGGTPENAHRTDAAWRVPAESALVLHPIPPDPAEEA